MDLCIGIAYSFFIHSLSPVANKFPVQSSLVVLNLLSWYLCLPVQHQLEEKFKFNQLAEEWQMKIHRKLPPSLPLHFGVKFEEPLTLSHLINVVATFLTKYFHHKSKGKRSHFWQIRIWTKCWKVISPPFSVHHKPRSRWQFLKIFIKIFVFTFWWNQYCPCTNFSLFLVLKIFSVTMYLYLYLYLCLYL